MHCIAPAERVGCAMPTLHASTNWLTYKETAVCPLLPVGS